MDWASIMGQAAGGSNETSSGAPISTGFGNVTFGNTSGGIQLNQKTILIGAGVLFLAFVISKK